MNQLESSSQLTHPQNTYRRLKGSTIRLFQRLGRHNAATRRQEELDDRTRGSHVQHPLDMSVGGRKEPDPTTANTGTRTSHAQDRLEVPVSGWEGADPTTANTGTRTSHAQDRLDVSVSGWKGETATTNTGTCTSHGLDRLEVSGSGWEGETATTNTATRGFHTQAQLHHASYDPLFHTTDPAESVVTTDVKQSNAFFQNAHDFNISGNPSFQNQNIGSVTNVYGGRKDGLENLKGFVSFDAQFDSSVQDPQRQCHPGTRQNVLKRLRDWIDNPKAKERIFWLYGPAGAGKSAIAQTIASLYARPKVAATFFFFKSDVNRNDGNRLFTTLAYQLAFSIPAIRAHIANSLYERPDLPGTGVETQFNQLLVRPFQVLNDDATQQLAPVIIIDGVDECTDENVQRRFLEVIGDAVKDGRFPLRFLIISRPELHIAQTIGRFRTPILTIDLATLDDANRDIEKYLVDGFSRIASEQGLDLTWPGPEIIHNIVYKSSGNFIYASVVIKFVGDPYSFAKTQLDIVLNMKPPKTMSPFAVLDQLFFEIIRRVPDQDFLQRYLNLLTARVSVLGDYGDLHKDDAVLMHVSEEELHANLRRMRSLLRFEPTIDVHHRSFLDFLHDSSRSCQYYTGQQGGILRYLEVFVHSLVRYIYAVIEQPDCHNTPHFTPRFRAMIETFPSKIDLSVNQWQELIQPLLDLQDKLLQIPNFAFTWHLLPCNDCTVFYILRELLHLGLHLGIYKGQHNEASVQLIKNLRNRTGVVSSTTTKIKKMNGNDLDSLLMSLFARLPEAMENWSPDKGVMKLVSAILHFDSAEVARSIRFVSDAQKLVDLLVYMICANNALSRIRPDGMRKAGLLALKIFSRVPVLPLSFFSNRNNTLFRYIWSDNTIPTQILSQSIFASSVLDRYDIGPMLGGYVAESERIFFHTDTERNNFSMTMAQWRQTKIPVPVTVRQTMLELAKIIQHFHSLGVVLHRKFDSDDVFLESEALRLKIRCRCSTSQFLLEQQWKAWFTPANNIFSFGCIFYELFSGVDTKPLAASKERMCIITNRPSVPEIPEFVWQLIQRCCAEDPKDRPPMGEVVQEMERWDMG